MKRGVPAHPKTLDLAAALDVEPWGAVGVLACLWDWATTYAVQGDIGRHSDAAIARGVSWHGEPARLIDALVAARWVDRDVAHRLVLHDWSHHADSPVRLKLYRAGLRFLDGTRPYGNARKRQAKRNTSPKRRRSDTEVTKSHGVARILGPGAGSLGPGAGGVSPPAPSASAEAPGSYLDAGIVIAGQGAEAPGSDAPPAPLRTAARVRRSQ